MPIDIVSSKSFFWCSQKYLFCCFCFDMFLSKNVLRCAITFWKARNMFSQPIAVSPVSVPFGMLPWFVHSVVFTSPCLRKCVMDNFFVHFRSPCGFQWEISIWRGWLSLSKDFLSRSHSHHNHIFGCCHYHTRGHLGQLLGVVFGIDQLGITWH